LKDEGSYANNERIYYSFEPLVNLRYTTLKYQHILNTEHMLIGYFLVGIR